MSPNFPGPPVDLADFPVVEFSGPLYRIHLADNDPWFFSSTARGRFNLTSTAGLGTCYLSTTEAGAFVEVFGDSQVIGAGLVSVRAISTATVVDKLRLANVADPKAIGTYGVSLAMSAHLDYGPTQQWATAFYGSGFDGIYYAARHDPSGAVRSVAVFGQAPLDPGRLAWASPEQIPTWLIDQVALTYGIEVLPEIF